MMPRTFGIVTLVVILSGFAAGPVRGQTPPQTVRVVSPAQILSRPSSDATVVSSADIGTILTVLDGDGQWYWVALPADRTEGPTRGWVPAADVQVIATDKNAVRQAPAPTSSIFIPPTAEELRAAQAQRETDQRERQLEEQRIEKARQELEQRRLEYEAATGMRPVAGSRSIPPASSPRKPPQPDARRYDLFGGYAWLWDSASSLSYPLGWVASVSGHLNDPLAIVGEVTGSYTSISAYGVNVSSESIHTFTAGPKLSGPRAGRFTTFGQILGGLGVQRSDTLGYSVSATGFALTPGFGADFPLAHSLGVRIGGEFGFLRSPLGWSGEFRLMTGLVVMHPQR